MLATLFVPAVVLLVPLYLIILRPALIDHSLVNIYWAVWLPAGASAFNVVLVARFFDNLPREIFEAAEIDGAGPFRLFWSIVLPMSKPILGVVSVFAVHRVVEGLPLAVAGAAKPDLQPLSVRLPSMGDPDKGTLMAALRDRHRSSPSSCSWCSSACSCAAPGSGEPSRVGCDRRR